MSGELVYFKCALVIFVTQIMDNPYSGFMGRHSFVKNCCFQKIEKRAQMKGMIYFFPCCWDYFSSAIGFCWLNVCF